MLGEVVARVVGKKGVVMEPLIDGEFGRDPERELPFSEAVMTERRRRQDEDGRPVTGDGGGSAIVCSTWRIPGPTYV